MAIRQKIKDMTGKTDRDLKKYVEEVTKDDVYEQFLTTAKKGHARQWTPHNLFEPEDLASFKDIVSTLPTTASTGEIDLAELFRLLEQAHPNQEALITAAKPSLAALINAHARFPFSKPVPLTRDALLRATMLLTDRGGRFFESDHALHPKRDENDRLQTIFVALAAPDGGAGVVNHTSVVQVLTRMPYPKRSEKMVPHTPEGGWEGVAERLDPAPAKDEAKFFTIIGQKMEPLVGLVKGLLGVQMDEEFMKEIASEREIDEQQFLAWGEKQMHLLEGLHKLFEPLFLMTSTRWANGRSKAM